MSPIAAVLLLCVAIVPAQAAPSNPLETRISVDVRQAPVRSFLDALSSQGKINFILGDGMEGKKVTATLHNASIAEAMKVLEELNGIGFRQLGHSNTFLVAPKDSPMLRPIHIEGGPELDKLVTVRVKQAPLWEVFHTISAQTNINFALAEGLDDVKVTAFLNRVTLREALEVLTAIKGLECAPLSGNAGIKVSRRS